MNHSLTQQSLKEGKMQGLYYCLCSESQEAPEAVHSPAEAGGGVGQRVLRQRVLRLRVL
jgi:hypothetical protein